MTKQLGSDGHMNGSFDTTRPHNMKLGHGILNTQGSADSHMGRKYEGSFDSATKFHRQNSGGGPSSHASVNSPHTMDMNHLHSQTSYSLTASEDSLHNSLQHSSSTSSCHIASGNAYSNIPVSSHATVNSAHLQTTDEPSIPKPCLSERPDSIPSLRAGHVLFHGIESMHQTPSPSDSGVGELEAMLREKDSEINTLREVMERNEHAIFQVYEERRNVWLHETQELQNEYERRLKVQNRKSYKTEQVLSLQVYKLQQEQKTLQEEKAKIISERESLRQQVNDNQNLISHLKQKLEIVVNNDVNCDKQINVKSSDDKNGNIASFQEELSLKNKELVFLKSQILSFQAELEKRNRELAQKVQEASTKPQEVKSVNDELQPKNTTAHRDSSTQTNVDETATSEDMKASLLAERDQIIVDLQEEIMQIQMQVALLKAEHEKEQEQWLDEKNKVIRYQKQLQLNYVQMQRKNAALEREVQQLTLELESRDIKLIALSGEDSYC